MGGSKEESRQKTQRQELHLGLAHSSRFKLEEVAEENISNLNGKEDSTTVKWPKTAHKFRDQTPP